MSNETSSKDDLYEYVLSSLNYKDARVAFLYLLRFAEGVSDFKLEAIKTDDGVELQYLRGGEPFFWMQSAGKDGLTFKFLPTSSRLDAYNFDKLSEMFESVTQEDDGISVALQNLEDAQKMMRTIFKFDTADGDDFLYRLTRMREEFWHNYRKSLSTMFGTGNYAATSAPAKAEASTEASKETTEAKASD